MGDLIGVVVVAVFLVIGLSVGKTNEIMHLRSLARREEQLRGQLLVTNLRQVPPEWQVSETRLVLGSVVIASDYFKTFAAGLKNLIGGHLRTLETLLMRARREALVRVQEEAVRAGANVVMNVRFETSTVGRVSGNKGLPSVELIAYATALRVERTDAQA